MTVYILLSAVIFFAGHIYVIRRHPDLRLASMILTLCVSLASGILLFPYHLLSLDPLLALLASINSGLKVVAMDNISDTVSKLGLSGSMAAVYQSLLYVCYIMAPVYGSLFILTISKAILDKMVLRRSSAVHVFSSLNRNSMDLMEYIADQYPHDQIMVLEQKDSSEELIKRASVVKTIFWKQDLNRLKLLKNTEYTFYQMDENDNENLNAFMKLHRFVREHPQEIVDHTQIKCFVASDSAELVRRIDQYISRLKGSSVRTSFVNEQNNQAYYLFHQLKDLIRLPRDHYEIAVIGAGRLGRAIINTALWLFDRQNCQLTIHVVDRHARTVASHMKLACPEVLNADLESYFSGFDNAERNYDIRFYEEDADGEALEKIFAEGDVHPDLVISSCGDDIDNLRISERLLRILCRRNDSISCCPIAVRIRGDETFEVLNDTDDGSSGIRYFGNQSEKYAQIFAINTILEQMAEKVHLAYLNTNENSSRQVLYDTGYYTLTNHESSLALALSMEYKLKYILADVGEYTDKKKALSDYLEDEENMRQLCAMEHDRWTAYQRISGWRRPSWHQAELTAQMHGNGRKIRHDRLLLHPAIVDNDELPQAEEKSDEILKGITENYAPSDYVNKDAYILRKMPEILASELN